MIYFSELKGKKVVTEDHVQIGILDDLIFLVFEDPIVTKLVVLDKLKNRLIIPASYLKKINSSVTIEKSYHTSLLEENELYIVRNLMDKQIIDLVGHKIVRVNDVALQHRIISEKFELYMIGIDIGLLGILRWLKLERLIAKICYLFNFKLSSKFLSWGDLTPLELARGKVQLKRTEAKLQKVRPEDLADYLERTNVQNASRFLKILEKSKAADVVSKLNLNYQANLFRLYASSKAAELLSMIDPDEAVDVLLTLSNKRRQLIIDNLSDSKKRVINHLLNLSTTEIGSLAISEFLKVTSNVTAREVIQKIKKDTHDFPFLNPIYVVNKDDELTGVFNIHELLLQDLDDQVYKFMVQNVIVIYLTTPLNIALNKMVKYNLAALPVIDENHKILGIVTVIDIFESLSNKIKFLE